MEIANLTQDTFDGAVAQGLAIMAHEMGAAFIGCVRFASGVDFSVGVDLREAQRQPQALPGVLRRDCTVMR